MYQELLVKPYELLFRAFFRPNGGSLDEAEMTDFDRRRKIREGGISLFRSEHVTYRFMFDKVKGRDVGFNRGLMHVRALDLTARGYKFYGNPTKPGHICLHCRSCNLLERNCDCMVGVCPFDEGDDDEERYTLAGIFQVMFDGRSIKDIDRILGKNVDESDVAEANRIYWERWLDEREHAALMVELIE